uniref:CSON009771 protein n=1 Tax=Culicoides sonorensis TaxID=179676 RepID=A0A336M0W3_CULSO
MFVRSRGDLYLKQSWKIENSQVLLKTTLHSIPAVGVTVIVIGFDSGNGIENLIRNKLFIQALVVLRNEHPSGPSAIISGSSCLQKLSKAYFHTQNYVHIPNLGVIFIRGLSSPAVEIADDHLKSIHLQSMEKSNNERVQIRVLSNYRFDSDLMQSYKNIVPTDFYVIVIDSLLGLEEILKYLIIVPSWNPYGKFIILFNNPNDLYEISGEALAMRVLETMFIGHHSVNIIFAYCYKINQYELYTGEPYHGNETECGKMKPISIGQCINGDFAQPSLTYFKINVPKVPKTMKTCTFNLCARVAEPFVNNDGCKTGLEISVINILKSVMEFKVNVTCYPSYMERGEIINSSIGWSHMLGKIRNDECDFIIGAFFPDYEVCISGTLSCTLGRTHPYFSTRNLVAISWYTFGRLLPELPPHHQITMCFLNSWALFLGVSTNNRPNYLTLRLFFGFLTLFALNVNTIYTSQLIDVFTCHKRAHQIDTIEEILNLKIPIGGRLENRDWFENEDVQDTLIFNLYNVSVFFQPSISTIKRIIRGQLSTILSRMYVKQQNIYVEHVHGLSLDVFSSPVEIICEKGFPLLKEFNKVLSNINDMGLTHKLMNDFEFNTTILQQIINTVSGNIDHEFDEQELCNYQTIIPVRKLY